MFNTTLLLLILATAIAFFTGCGNSLIGFEAAPKTYSMDGAKIISPDIDDGLSEKSMNLDVFSISPTRRLLLRFESFNNHVSKIDVAATKVVLSLSLKDLKTMDVALSSIKACPVTSNWMMAATWKQPHPRVKWVTEGGDIDLDGCVKATNMMPEVPKSETSSSKDLYKKSEAVPKASTTELYFDMTQWFIDYPLGRNVNYGFIIISEKPLVIHGDRSGSFSPRMHWKERP